MAVNQMLELLRDALLLEAGQAPDLRVTHRLSASGHQAAQHGIRVAPAIQRRRAERSISCIGFADRFARIVCEGAE
jgi:hypothetical protein